MKGLCALKESMVDLEERGILACVSPSGQNANLYLLSLGKLRKWDRANL